ncbi:MAG: hypothetical protein LBF09_07545, partial [Odoribacteraceae bacterium]|nr:hypothetical protein [Odoribacteraceae bacterium]
FRHLANILKNSLSVTPLDLEAMGLLSRDESLTPSPVETTHPDSVADTSELRRVLIHYGTATPGKTRIKKGKPRGQHGAECRWALSKTAVTSLDELTNSAFDTNSPLVLEFGEEERGARLYYAMRWENNRGERGPFGPIEMIVVP